ncbi:MAG: 2-oxo-4-hydroxy-4-carboxy-5-ureidoimidazoline decarboxylase, partial [Chloroflexota bacterium]|nr:2-oxo-4-hydroxy-4-carboxy-5-ureidoimidazoline decarboxylase [Chloroflexota bacterium]
SPSSGSSPRSTEIDAAPFPSAEDLDRLPAPTCEAELVSLFGRAPSFLARLVETRPFVTDEQLVTAAYQLGRELSDADAVELVNAHPSLAVNGEALSSRAAAPPDGESDEAELADSAWIDEELTGLNEVYEDRFGFPYTVFDTGRPRAEIIPLLEVSLRNDRDVELRRAVAECIAVAEDRLRRLRRGSEPEGPEDPVGAA